MSWRLKPPDSARPPRGARETASAYSRRLKNLRVCQCDDCCEREPWRRRYLEWRQSVVRRLFGVRAAK